MLSNNTFMQRFLIINACILFIFSFFIFPTNDTYYYWTWSQNLQLSYYDGPPLIAWLLWLSTHLFGNNFFAIEIISTLCIYGSSFLLYKIVREFSTKEAAVTAVALWMVYPFATTRFIAVSMTLDGPEVFFSLLLIFVAFKWIKYQQLRYIYLLGIVTGLCMLAKYNTIILIAGLMAYFMWQKELRKIYLSPHLYAAGIIAIIIFSPVLIWNYQNHWASFIYQLNSHKWDGAKDAINSAKKQGLRGVWFYVSSCVFGVLNIFLLIMVYIKYVKQKVVPDNYYNRSIAWLIWFILLFWLYKSYSAHIGLNYMVTVSSLIVIIVAQQLSAYPKFTKLILVLFGIITLAMLIDKSRLHKSDTDNYNKYVKSGLVKRLFL